MLDEGAPALAAGPFEKAGHGVIRFLDVLSSGAQDQAVAAMAILNSAALVATDRDYRRMTKRFGTPAETWRFPKLNLIFLECDPVLGPKRLDHLMSLIEHEWRVACEKASRAMWLEIGPHHFRSFR